MAPNGPRRFLFLLIQTLPPFWAERICILRISIWGFFWDSKFLDFQVPRFPGPQKSGLGQAWAGLGSGLGQAWERLGKGLGRAWAGLGPGLGQAWAGLGPGLGRAWAGPGRRPLGILYLSWISWIYLGYIWIYFLVLQPVISSGGLESNFEEATNEKLP